MMRPHTRLTPDGLLRQISRQAFPASALAGVLMAASGAALAASETGDDNAFGLGAGTLGSNNSAFGANAGHADTAGSNGNSFFGYGAGRVNSDGSLNSFFGVSAGGSNLVGNQNVFLGASSGAYSTGGFSTFTGVFSGADASGNNNAMYGAYAGAADTGAAGAHTGGENVYIGSFAGRQGTAGGDNTFVGYSSGMSNTVENYNSTFGAHTDVSPGISNASAIGANAVVQQSDSLVLGSIAGVNGALANVRVGIGTPAPMRELHVKGDSGGLGTANISAVLVENSSATRGNRRMLDLVSNGGSQIGFTDSGSGVFWTMQNSGNDFVVQRGGRALLRLSADGSASMKYATNPAHFALSSTGNLSISGVLTQGSDVNLKHDIVALDGQDLLARLDRLPVSAWSYKTDGSNARHAGPMAQDFQAVFGLGDDPTRLAPGDEAGVALAAIKQLRADNLALHGENQRLQVELGDRTQQLQTAMDGWSERMTQRDATLLALQDRLARMEQAVAAAGTPANTVALGR